jgi:hypothetical protein
MISPPNFFMKPGMQEFFMQPQTGKRFHAERQQRFANVKPRKFFAFEHSYVPPAARKQRRGSAPSRASSDDCDVIHLLVLTVLILANYRKFGRTHLLNNGVMLSKAKHLCFVSEPSIH